MTAFLWTVVILMAAALAAEVLAFLGMALVARRVARRAQAIRADVAQRLEPSVRVVKELKLALQPRAETISRDGKEMGSLLATRFQAVQAAYLDTSRRVVEPIAAASKVLRGLGLALWLLRKVA